MDKQDIKKMLSEIEREDKIFSKKSYLDNLSFPKSLVGREKKAKELVRFLMGYQKGLVVPFISVYGRSGSGKSTVVRFVCENLDEIEFGFVNLRNAKTIFGSANLILAEMGKPNINAASGLHSAIQQIGVAIKEKLEQTKKQLYVLVLDEFDTIFYDKRSKPSDFVYKLIILEEELRQTGYQMCIIGISNNVVSEYELDDRIKSRIGSSEIFFEPYSKDEVIKILKDRAKYAFSENIPATVLEYCADLSSQEHGDARRAIDLLRVGAEIASMSSEKISKNHIDLAHEKIQNERVVQVLSNASYHLKLVCAALARITFLSGQDWHYTSTIHKQYGKIIASDAKPLTYRRVSDLLIELQNTGIVTGQTRSQGRHGYGTQFKLLYSPEMIGKNCFPKWWDDLIKRKLEFDVIEEQRKALAPMHKRSRFGSRLSTLLSDIEKKKWNGFVGMD